MDGSWLLRTCKIVTNMWKLSQSVMEQNSGKRISYSTILTKLQISTSSGKKGIRLEIQITPESQGSHKGPPLCQKANDLWYFVVAFLWSFDKL